MNLLKQYLKFYFSFNERLNRKNFFLGVAEISSFYFVSALPFLAGVLCLYFISFRNHYSSSGWYDS